MQRDGLDDPLEITLDPNDFVIITTLKLPMDNNQCMKADIGSGGGGGRDSEILHGQFNYKKNYG